MYTLIERGFFSATRMVVACHSFGCPGMPGDMSIYASANPHLSDYAQPSFVGSGADFCAVHQEDESCYEYRSRMRSGMGAFRTLKEATSVNAEILGMEDKVGTIEPGKLADLAGWHRNLLQDPDALFACDFVMKDGVRHAVSNQVIE